MTQYVIRRLLESIPTFIGITIVSFVIIHLVPGNIAQVFLGPRATPFLIAQVNRELGLNKPVPVQYLDWLWQLLHGNLGVSYFQNQSVWQLILINVPRTLAIVGIGVLISHVLSIVLGVFQAYKRNTWIDHVLTAVSYFFYSMPVFWLGVIMIIVFSIDINWLPSGGISNPLVTNPGFGSWAQHIALPVATLVLWTVAGWGRYMRSATSESLIQDYIRTARAKGLSDLTVLLKHALRNSIMPLITLFGLSLPALFSGALLIEVVFNYPGLGLLFYNAAIQRDYPVVLGGVVVIGTLTVLGNLIADVLYSLVDPRIQYR
jgi:peptide/nickel transport system permease protein